MHSCTSDLAHPVDAIILRAGESGTAVAQSGTPDWRGVVHSGALRGPAALLLRRRVLGFHRVRGQGRALHVSSSRLLRASTRRAKSRNGPGSIRG